MDVNRIFSAEQIAVPPDLPHVLKDWTKAVIRENPSDVLLFSLKYFQDKTQLASQKKATENQVRRIKQLFEQYDIDGNGRMEAKELKRFVLDDLALSMGDSEIEDVMMDLDPDSTGFIELSDIIQWYTKR
jgi:hypothetical protein